MKLTKHILEQISWWEVTAKSGFDFVTGTWHKTVFTLHFKKWWRWPKRIVFPHVKVHDKDYIKFYQADGATELEAQLKTLE